MLYIILTHTSHSLFLLMTLLRGCTKKQLHSTSQSQACTKKRSQSLLWSDPPQLSESQGNHYIWEVCSANRWDALPTAAPAAGMVNRKGPILRNNAQLHIAQPILQKLNELSYKVPPHPPYSPDLLPTDYHFFKHLDNFLQGKHLHN